MKLVFIGAQPPFLHRELASTARWEGVVRWRVGEERDVCPRIVTTVKPPLKENVFPFYNSALAIGLHRIGPLPFIHLGLYHINTPSYRDQLVLKLKSGN